METRRLELLVALARLGSMRAVGEELGITTSTVSQQLAALAAETGSTLLEPVGRHVRPTPPGDAAATIGRYREHNWIVNSRNNADELVVATVAALAGFTPTLSHRSDSLDLLQDMIAAGLGVGLLPEDGPTRDGVRVLPL